MKNVRFFFALTAVLWTMIIQAQTTITCQQAREYALSVANDNDLYNEGASYKVRGYVTSIQIAWDAAKHQVTFWMADTENGGNVIEAYRCVANTKAEAPNVGSLVEVTGKLTKYKTTPEFAAGCTCTIINATAEPVNLGHKTIAEFLALKNTKDTCVLTGVVTSIVSTEYGNLNIADETGAVYVYGLSRNADGTAMDFNAFGIEEGDTLTLSGMYRLYGTLEEVVNPRYITHRKPATDYSKTVVDFETDFEDGWEGWIGKTLTFTNDFYLCNTYQKKVAYMRLRSPEEYGEQESTNYLLAEQHNQWADCNLYGVTFTGKYRAGTIIRGLQALVDSNSLTAVNTPQIIYNELPTQRPDLGNANLVVCEANIENFFVHVGGYAQPSTTEEQMLVQKAKISKALCHIDADIYAICEMEQGPDAAPVMVAAMNELAGKDQYTWINPGFPYADAIMVCFIYRKDKVKPVGDYIMPYTSTSSAYHYREAIQCFEHLASGEKFNISLNHFKAKAGSNDTSDGQRQTNMSILINYGLPQALQNDPDILVVGDLNAYTMETSNTMLSSGQGYVDLLMKYSPDGYSFVFDSRVGYLDHAYCTPSMESQVTMAAPYHLNADTWKDYEFTKGDNSMYRYADHDPLLIGLHLGNDTASAIDDTDSGRPAVRKEIRHGQLIIIRGDQVYTVTGQHL